MSLWKHIREWPYSYAHIYPCHYTDVNDQILAPFDSLRNLLYRYPLHRTQGGTTEPERVEKINIPDSTGNQTIFSGRHSVSFLSNIQSSYLYCLCNLIFLLEFFFELKKVKSIRFNSCFEIIKILESLSYTYDYFFPFFLSLNSSTYLS